MEKAKAIKRKPKEKTRRRRALITDRDMDIFRMLSSGPATFVQIRLFMEKIYKRHMSESVLWTRLSKLKGGGYINSRRYAGREQGRFSLYSLTPLSIELLAKAGYPAGGLRAALPDDAAVAHEMLVTDVVRAIKREGFRLYEYQLADRNILKQASGGIKRSHAYPDLHVRLTLNVNGTRHIKTYDIEVDNTTALPVHAIRKVGGLSHTTLVLCSVAQRIDALKRALAASEARGISGRVFFCLLPDFIKNGFAGTDWIDVNGKKITLIDVH